MSLLGLLNQSVIIYNKASLSASGREVFGTGSTVSARVQAKRKRILAPNGQVLVIEATAFVGADVTVNTDDKLTHEGYDYKILDVYPVIAGNGNVHHKELKLIKWQST